MIVNHEKKYIYIAVPKTATVSIHVALGYLDYVHNIPEPEVYHQGIGRTLAENPSCVNYTKFGFVRNPWDRLVSLYNDFRSRGRTYSPLVKLEKPLLSEFVDFTDMCLNLYKSPWRDDVFFRPQHTFFEDKMDIIGRFENLTQSFKRLRIMFQCGPLPHFHIGAQEKDYRKHYNYVSRLAISRLYADDIKKYNYEF